MRTKKLLPIAITVITLSNACASDRSASTSGDPVPPDARQIPETLEAHGHTRVDNYYWLNQRDNPEVIEYLEAENGYTDAVMASTASLQEDLFDEIKGRIRQTDVSVPVKEGDFFNYYRTEEGADYPVYARRRGSMDAPEEILLDVNLMAEGHDYYNAFPVVNSSGNLMAWAEDTRGRRIYTIRIRNLETGEDYSESIEGSSGNMVWAEDGESLFYMRRDPGTLRSFQAYLLRLGDDPSEDVLVYEEEDEEFSSFVWKTKSKEYIVISSSHTLADEHRYVDARAPRSEFTLFMAREEGHEHRIDHLDGHFYIRTNRGGAANFMLARTPDRGTGIGAAEGSWETVIPHRDDVLLQGFELFRDHLVVSERFQGLTRLLVRDRDGESEHHIAFDEPAYVASISNNPEWDTNLLRFNYQSLSTPWAIYEYDMGTRERTLLKQDEVLGEYDPADYVVERLAAPSRDGAVEIPISIVYPNEFERNGSQPLLLYAYGSYGSNTEPSFSSSRLSLLERGFAWAIAHVRGGQELGRHWYEDGKMFNKKNTFTDFVDVADYLVQQGYTSPERLFARGGSAGGLLMGAVANMRPDLFRGIVAHVPFVDVVTTMSDASIPLTTFEWDEWGNPADIESYRYMLSYSPYDQVTAQDYPDLLVTTGLHDSQVQYWEPAKWVAKLRDLNTSENRILLKTHMDAGHGGGSGRDRGYEELAFEFAFMLDILEGS